MTKDGFIYFMKPVGMDGPIKIGCSNWPSDRLKQIMVWSPVELELLHCFKADRSIERKLHRCFSDLHVRSEWFKADDRLVKFIADLVAGVQLEIAIDLNDDRGPINKGNVGKRTTPPEMQGYISYSSRLRNAARRVSKNEKHVRALPDDVQKILSKWQGYARGANGFVKLPQRPTDEQFKRLDEVIKNPEIHCPVSCFRKKTEKAAA